MNKPISAFAFLAVISLFSIVGVTRLETWVHTNGDWLNGEKTSALSNAYDENHFLKNIAVNFWAAVAYTLFREGKPGLHIGQDGWLFTEEEILPAERESEQVSAALALIGEVKNLVHQSGSELIVAVVPAKWRLADDKINTQAIVDEADNRRTVLLDYLEENQLMVVDGFSAMKSLGRQSFLRTDTHWSHHGARSVATDLVVKLKEAFPSLPYSSVHYQLKQTGFKVHQGDLLKFLPLGYFESIGPPQEKIETFHLEQTLGSGNSSKLESSLFGSEDFPVALVGTSYSANTRWHFADALQTQLGFEVLNVSQEAKGPLVPMFEYLDSQDFLESPPDVIIWEFPERYLGIAKNIALLEKRQSIENKKGQGNG